MFITVSRGKPGYVSVVERTASRHHNTQWVVRAAHTVGAAVEVELGHVGVGREYGAFGGPGRVAVMLWLKMRYLTSCAPLPQ